MTDYAELQNLKHCGFLQIGIKDLSVRMGMVPDLMAQSVMYTNCRKIFCSVEPLHNAYPRDKVRESVMTSQVRVRFFKYEMNYFTGESVQHLNLKKGLLQHIKSVTHSKYIHKSQTKTKRVINAQSVGSSTSLFTLMFH